MFCKMKPPAPPAATFLALSTRAMSPRKHTTIWSAVNVPAGKGALQLAAS